MANYLRSDYQLNYARYKHYYRQIWKYYQKPVVKVSFALLLTIFTIIFFAVFAIKPTLVTIAELLKTIEEKEEVLAKLKKKAAALNSAQNEYSLNSDGIARLNQAVPDDKDVQELMTMVEATAAHHALVIDSFSFSELEYKKNPSLPDAVTIPFTISLTADYVSLKSFLHDLVRLPRFLSVESISFSEPDGSDDPTSSTDSIQLSIRLNAHYMPTKTKP